MAERITFAGVDSHRVGDVEVLLRSRWTAEWQLVRHLHCEHASWCAAPSVPTATLSWIYGRIARENDLDWQLVQRLTNRRRAFVKVRFYLRFNPNGPLGNQWTTRDWYGVLDIDADMRGGSYTRQVAGAPTSVETGEQKFVCYGLERLLMDQTIAHSYWRDDGAPERIARGIPFNGNGKPNRHPTLVAGLYSFGRDPQTVKHWSTRQIIDYLLFYHSPKNAAGLKAVPFEVAPDGGAPIIPNWDRPELPAHGMRTYELIDQLLPRQRLISWYLRVNEQTNVVQLVPFTFTEADIGVIVAGAQPIPANPRQFELDFDGDRSANAAIKLSAVDSFDQVVMQGSRRRSCFNVSFADFTLKRGWTPTEENWYRVAASADADYPALGDIKEREQRNKQARQAERVQRVYCRYDLHVDDGLAGDGGTGPTPIRVPIFPIAGQPEKPFPVYTLDMELLPTLPLLVGVDYSGDKIPRGTVDETTQTPAGDEMPLHVAWQLPAPAAEESEEEEEEVPPSWINIERLGALASIEQEDEAENHEWSASVHVVPHSKSFEIRVHGEPQHVVASALDFTPLAEDVDLGKHDFRKMIATVCVHDDRYCEAIWPEPAPGAIDALRVLYIDAGDSYLQDYIVPQTVVSIGSDGQLVRTDGGYIRDDTTLLKAAAKVAYSWYGRDRAVLELRTAQLTEQLFVGDFITEIGNFRVAGAVKQTIRSVITEVQIYWPRATDSAVQQPVMMFITAAGELDALRLIGPGGSGLKGDPVVVLPRRPVKL